jgi:transposase
MNTQDINIQEVKEKKAQAKTAKEYLKWHVLDLVTDKKLAVRKISEVTEVPKPTIYGWIRKYRAGGAEKLIGKKKGGRRSSIMSLEEEKALLNDLFSSGSKGLIITAKVVHKTIEERVGRIVSLDVAYDMLHRHGWRKLVPRPSHPDQDKEKQEEFKKTFPSLWKPPIKSLNHQMQDR